MGWLLQAPSPIWLWVGLICGFIALGVGVLTLPQIIWGRPRLIVNLECIGKAEGDSLHCWLLNPPITNRFLQLLNVEGKDIRNLIVVCAIADMNGGQFAIGAPQIMQGNKPAIRPIDIHNSFGTAEFNILIANDKGTQYAEGINGKPLIPQEYYIYLKFLISGRWNNYNYKFAISEKPPYITLYRR
jgi:hypothetical protein